MHCAKLKPGRQRTETQDIFLGLNRNLRTGPGEFFDMKNLTSDRLPVLSPRPRRGLVREGSFQGLGPGLISVEEGALVMGGRKIQLGLSREGDKQLVRMGAYVIILPDKVYFNTADPGDYGPIEARAETAAPVQLTQCTLDGQEIRPEYVSAQAPQAPGDRAYWLDLGERKLKQYGAALGLWITIETPFVKLSCPGVGRGFRDYDGVVLAGLPEPMNGAAILYRAGEDFVIFPGLLDGSLVLDTPVTIAREMPDMDYVIECGNRLWGCRYGPDRRGRVVNELYACKLGDFRNWSCYLGISTDSYRVSLGADGPFTGAVSYGGHPIFFRESCMHKVFGQFPANFQVQTNGCRGVDRGADRSLAIVSEVLYYKSREGICAYDGSLPRQVSQALGPVRYGKAVAGAVGDKYYVSLQRREGDWELLVLDTARGVWHREDGLEARFFARSGQELYCVDSRGRLLALLGSEGTREQPVSWMAQTGIIGAGTPGSRYLTALRLRLLLEPGSRVRVLAQYDSLGPWEALGAVEGMHLQSFVLPVIPRRCDHLRLRLEGTGNALLFAVTRVMQPGGI